MAESSIVTVVPNLNNSFKLSAAGNLVGAISQDRATGVYGQLGDKPRMVPVKLGLTDGSSTELLEGDLAPGDQLITEVSGVAAPARRTGAF